MEINLLLSYSSIHKKSYFVQKNRTWCRKGKILEVGCRLKKKNKADDRYKKFNDRRLRLCQELRTTVFYFKRHLEHQKQI